MAYSIFVLLLPWTIYAAAPESGPEDHEQSIASIYDAMAQPLLWQQQKHIVKKGNQPDPQQKANDDSDEAIADGTPPPPQVRPLRAYASLPSTPPHLHINLPSWRGLIPYNIPPPARLPA